MPLPLAELVKRWLAAAEVDLALGPDPAVLADWAAEVEEPCREGADPAAIASWEERHGFRLPQGLRSLLILSNGLYRLGPLVHPISAIGPMIPFAANPGMLIQPESWFELGNPNLQTVCIDLAYRLPGAGCPVFTSGDDHALEAPRVIARSFDEWFLELLRQGGREYWFDRGYPDLGAPWRLHREHVAAPPLESRLAKYRDTVRKLATSGACELEIALELGLSRPEVESIVRHIQHEPAAPLTDSALKASTS